MPTPLKKITLTITNDLLLHILAQFKEKKQWSPDKTIEHALREFFDNN
jgi:hypothetical protein